MRCKIREIAIYRKANGEVRKIRFHDGLNTIPGKRQKGKSAVLSIVDYCLLSEQCNIPRGKVRDYVSHVGLLLERDDGNRLSIVRPLPGPGAFTVLKFNLTLGPTVELPEKSTVCDWTKDVAKELVAEYLRMPAASVLKNYKSLNPNERYEIGVRHCTPFLFQTQSIIANPAATFPQLEDFFKKRDVIDALPFLLGVVTGEMLAKQMRLHELEREKNKLERRLAEERSLQARGYDRGLELWNRAVQLGLKPNQEPPTTLEELQAKLASVAALTIQQAKESDLMGVGAARSIEAKLRRDVRQLQADIAELSTIGHLATRHDRVVDGQRRKLAMVEILPHVDDAATCPLCSNKIQRAAAEMLGNLRSGLRELDRTKLEGNLIRSRVDKRLAGLQEDLARRTEEHRSAQTQLRNLEAQVAASQKLADEDNQRLLLVGAAQQYVTTVRETPIQRGLNADHALQLQALSKEVGDLRVEERTRQVRDRLAVEMSRLASDLPVEDPGAGLRLNLSKFVLELQSGEKGKTEWIPLSEVGSGANWLGYHVAAAVGLHRLFLAEKAPVPSFLLLDQPSQAWFPPQNLESEAAAREADDHQDLRRVYNLLHKEARDGLQIIVVDHARFEDGQLGKAEVENWRLDDRALVPYDWMK